MKGLRAPRHQTGMKTKLLPLLSLLASCTIGHVVGENQQNHDAVTCAAITCGGTTVCVDSACVEPTGTCGGFAGSQCPTGQRCVDNPRDGCTQGVDPDCGGVCVAGSTTPPPDAGTQPRSCGGHVANPQTCPSGYKCVDDPTSCSMAVDCTGICVVDSEVIRDCGGFRPNPPSCNSGEVCVDNPNTASMTVDAPGICLKKVFCGGIAAFACPGGMSCVDDPSDSCDPTMGGADCGGYCVWPKGSGSCGGIAGIQCAAGLRCLDDPADSCDPANGGADCGGICVP